MSVKNGNIKLVLIVFLAFVVSFTLIYFMDESLKIQTQSSELNNKEKDLDSEKNRIFLFGSSRMMGIDSEYIDYILLTKGEKVDVYNHGLSNETPSRRLTVLDKSLVENPDMVLIGVDIYSVLGSPQKSQESTENFPSRLSTCSGKLPTVQDLYSIFALSKELPGIDLSNFNNPKLTTLKFIDTKINPEKYSEANKERSKQMNVIIENVTTEFQEMDVPSDFEWSLETMTEKQAWGFGNPDFWQFANKQAIENNIQQVGMVKSMSRAQIDPNGSGVNALKKIIEKLQENKIKVVIFTTPIYKTLYEAAYPCLIDDFESLMDGFSKNYDVPVYYFHDKYFDLKIWRDRNHIVNGPTIYSEDIAEIIFKEIN